MSVSPSWNGEVSLIHDLHFAFLSLTFDLGRALHHVGAVPAPCPLTE